MSEPFFPHRTGMGTVLLIGTAAQISCDRIGPGNDWPILEIRYGGIYLTIEPYGPAECGVVTACDVERAKELAEAAAQYHHDLAQRLAESERVAALLDDLYPRRFPEQPEPPDG